MSDMMKTLEHMHGLSELRGVREIPVMAEAVLEELGLAPRETATGYLLKAVQLRLQDPRKAFKKGVYPEAGRLSSPQAGPRRVEDQITQALEEAWNHRDPAAWSWYFTSQDPKKKPTNGQFISRLARLLALWQQCSFDKEWPETN